MTIGVLWQLNKDTFDTNVAGAAAAHVRRFGRKCNVILVSALDVAQFPQFVGGLEVRVGRDVLAGHILASVVDDAVERVVVG